MLKITAAASAPPTPCTNRPATSSGAVSARPQSRLAAVKTARPARNTRAGAEQVAEPAGEQQQPGEADQDNR